MSIEKDRFDFYDRLEKMSDQNRSTMNLKKVVSRLKDVYHDAGNNQSDLKYPRSHANLENAMDPPYIFEREKRSRDNSPTKKPSTQFLPPIAKFNDSSESFFGRKLPIRQIEKSEKTMRPVSQISKTFGYYPPEITRIGRNIK